MRSSEYVVAEWSEMPYTSHDRRGAVVEHRVVFEPFSGIDSVDVRHEVRSDDDRAKVSDEWAPVKVFELRNGFVNELSKETVLRS